MSLLGAIRARFARSLPAPSAKAVSFEDSWRAALAGTTRSGPAVTDLTALQVTTVLRCVRVLGNGVAQVPLKLYREAAGGRGSEEAKDVDLYRVLHRRPNKTQTSFQFRRQLVLHRALAGAFAAYKNRAAGRIRELIPIDPHRVEVVVNRDLSRTFRVTWGDSSRQDLTERDIWYLPDLTWDSRRVLGSVRMAREAIGLAMAAERTHAEFHRNGARTSGIISVEQALGDERYKLLEAWVEAKLTADNSYRPLLLDNGAKFSSMGMTGLDAENIALRKHQIEEICRAFDVFPQMVGHAGDQTPTFASAEQFFIAHVVHTLTPWYEDIEQSIDLMLEEEGEDGVFAKFNQRGLLRGAMKDEAEYFSRALGNGGSPPWLTQNEVRELQDRNPLPGGDELRNPAAATSAPPSENPDEPDEPRA